MPTTASFVALRARGRRLPTMYLTVATVGLLVSVAAALWATPFAQAADSGSATSATSATSRVIASAGPVAVALHDAIPTPAVGDAPPPSLHRDAAPVLVVDPQVTPDLEATAHAAHAAHTAHTAHAAPVAPAPAVAAPTVSGASPVLHAFADLHSVLGAAAAVCAAGVTLTSIGRPRVSVRH